MIGQTLDKRYKIIRKLGSGGFGEAFLARDISLHGILCVVKQLKPIDKSERFLKIARRLFVTESETLLRLGKHDQIPTLLAHLEKEKDFFLVQEFVDGHPLSAEIKANQPWAIDDVVDLLASALEPLAFAHANNVIHRDIKPDNLMRRHSDGKVVLIDFGAVKEVVNSSQIARKPVLTVCIGTPGYMPIEQASGNPKFSSDIYALGITCIQALTGLSAQELDPISWRHLINVDASLADILDSMVHYDFNHRYKSGSEALEAVLEYVKENPRTSQKVPYSPPPELVNNYSYSSATVPTRKVSIATRVSTTFHLPETLVSKVFLWLQLSSIYALSGIIPYAIPISILLICSLNRDLSHGITQVFSIDKFTEILVEASRGENFYVFTLGGIFTSGYFSLLAIVYVTYKLQMLPPRLSYLLNSILSNEYLTWTFLFVFFASIIPLYTYPTFIGVYIYVAWLSSFQSPYLLIDIDYEDEYGKVAKKKNERRDELRRWEKYVKEYLKKRIMTGDHLLWLFCNLTIPCVANLISWNIVKNSAGERILSGFVFQKEKVDYLTIILALPILQVAIYGMMMSVIIVLLTLLRESDIK